MIGVLLLMLLTQGLPPNTGVLSGVIRYADGTPASGIPVVAARVPLQTPPSRTITAWTGPDGAYRLESIAPGTYYIAAGFAENAMFYPGVRDISSAITVVTTSATPNNAIDFILPAPLNRVRVTGMVTARGGAPATGATVEIKSRTPRVSSPVGLPFVFYPTPAILGTDGRFEFYDVVPGEYTVQASYSEVRGESRTVVISTQSIRDLNLSIPVSVLTGQIFAEDGTAFPDAEAFVEVLMTAVGNPRMAVTTKLPIAGDGTFRRILEQDTYRFRLRVLPEEYSVTSIRAGNAELLNQTLIVGANEPAPVRVVVGRKTALQNQPRRVSGTVYDAVTGSPVAADRVTLCCREVGPAERLSAAVRRDGSFEFADIPAGRYAVGLETKSADLFVVGGNIEIGNQGAAGIELMSTSQFTELAAKLQFEDGRPVDLPASIVFTGSGGRVRVVANQGADGIQAASVPVGDRYEVSVTNLPEGYSVKSIAGSTEARPQNFPSIGVAPPPTPIVITLTRPR